ncbi:MAG TPA: hypothetical protein VMK12_05020, partial [Anaeromyxobacteraceae bacterium]|nr:hypothetical protein [Anaeromyxobacteraceae bacterium]
MLHSDRSAEVSPSLALGYWEGLRSTHPWRGKDDTDDPLGAIERFEREHGLTALHLRAMKFYLEEEGKKAISNPIRPLHTLLVERVFEQRLVEARRWFDERERALEVRL